MHSPSSTIYLPCPPPPPPPLRGTFCLLGASKLEDAYESPGEVHYNVVDLVGLMQGPGISILQQIAHVILIWVILGSYSEKFPKKINFSYLKHLF